MKRPFDTILELFRNNIARSAELANRNFEFLHQFTIWLLGFSIGAMYLIGSNFLNLKSVLSYGTIKAILIILAISVIAGILHRIFLFLYQVLYNTNVFYAEGAFSNETIMAQNPKDVSQENDIEKLINLLKFDYDEDDSGILKLYNESSPEYKTKLIEFLKKKYTGIGEWAKRDYEIAFNHVNTVMKNAFGVTEKELKKAAELSSKKIRFLRFAFIWMLYISCLSFMIALIVLVCAY